jgi:hypothetical protein
MTRRVVLVTGDASNQSRTRPAYAKRPCRGTGEHSATVTGLRAIHAPNSSARPRRRTPETSQPGNDGFRTPTRTAPRHTQYATAAQDHHWHLVEEIIMTAKSADGGEAHQPRPVSYDDAVRIYGPGTTAARERHHELSTRHHLARAYAQLRATGQYDPAQHGTGDAEPLTAAEHLELLAIGEYLSRSYKPVPEVDHALRAGASWAQIADALGTDEPAARAAYRAWADGQHDLLAWTEGRLGMSDAEHAEAMQRASHSAVLEAEA